MATRDLAVRLSLKDGEKTKQGLVALGEAGQKALQRIERSAEPASRSLVALNAAAGETRGGMEELAGRLGPIGAAMSAIGTGGLAAAAGVGALALGLAGAIAKAKDAANSFAEINREASRVGIGVTAFQEIAYAARTTGVDVEKLGEALKEMAGRALDAFQNGGEAAEGFARIGLSQKDLQSKLGDTDRLFTEVLDRIGKLKTDGERILTVQQIFGDEGGEPLLALIARGADEFARLRKEAHDMGVVVDEHVIKTGAEAARQLDVLSNIIDGNLGRAVVDLAPILVEISSLFAEIARTVADLVDSFRDLENRSTRGLQTRLAELKAERQAVIGRRDEIATSPNPFPSMDGRLGRNFEADRRTNVAAVEGRIGELDTEIARITAILDARNRAPTAPAPRPAPAPAKPETGRGSTASTAAAEEVDRVGEYIQRLRDQNALLEVEEEQRRRLEAVMQAQAMAMDQGRLLTQGERDEITRLVDAIGAYEDAVKAADEAQSEMQDFGRDVGKVLSDGLADAITKADSLTDSLRNVANALLTVALRAAFKPVEDALGNAVSGIFGSIFGSGLNPMHAALTGTVNMMTPLGLGVGFHDGGIAGGKPTFTRTVPAAAWDGAPRYHGGGVAGIMPGEVPAILKKGEVIFTPEQMRALGSAMAPQPAAQPPAQPDITVNVINQSGMPLDARQGGMRLDGERYVLDVVMKAASQPGMFREALKGAMR